MENVINFNPELGNIGWTATMIERIHRCENCPIRKMAIKLPQSIFARLHRWHKVWWPGWKAHQARSCAYSASVKAHA
jgi:hypothetical protein